MSKVLQLDITNCEECPWYSYEFSGDGVYCDINNGHRLIISNADLLKQKQQDGPKLMVDTVPDWCPLPDGNKMQYFVVREELEDISDNEAIDKTYITAVKLGKETWILNTYEKDRGVELVDDVGHVADERHWHGIRADTQKKVAVILGRVVTEKEVDLDRENLKRDKEYEEG